MGRPEVDPTDLVAQLQDFKQRIERLEGRTGIRAFTAASRPAAAALPRTLIANLTTGKVEWSDGAVWNPLY